jgi:hypothetical protein
MTKLTTPRQKKTERADADRPRPSQQSAGQASDSEVAYRAYELFVARGCRHGGDLDDWLQAERELRNAGYGK